MPTTTPVLPAADVWSAPMPETMSDRVEFFRENGFLLLRNLLDAAEVAALKAETDRVAREWESITPVREGFGMEPTQDQKRVTPTFRKIGGINAYSDTFAAVLKHPVILDHLHPIIGETILLWRDVVMMKPARVGREKPWHQDSSYWPWDPMRLVSAMIALDDATPENGCLQIIPGTHKKPVQHYGDELQIDLDEQMQARTLYVPLEAGDCLLFHSLLLHASEPNRSEHDRRVLINSYMPDDLEFIGKGEPKRDQPVVSVRPGAA